ESNPNFFYQPVGTEVVETFYDHDSADAGSLFLPQFPNNDWDRFYFKGQCPAGSFITGIAQTGNWDAPAPSGTGTKPRFTVDHLLCSQPTSTCDSPGGLLSVGNQSTAHPLRGIDPPVSLGGNWASSFDRLECADSEVMVGISVDVSGHKPHRIL